MLYCRYSDGYGLLLFFLLCLGSAKAQQIDSVHIKELEKVQVSSSRKRFLAASVTPVQSLSGDALQRMSSFSVADAIRYFSGVQLKDYGGIGGLKTVNVRSMGTQHVGVFLDGVSVGNAQNGTVDLGKFSLDNIDVIELYNGHNPEILQPAKAFFSSAGLYLQTARPHFDATQEHKISASFKTGSFGLANPSVLWQQKLSNDLVVAANAELITANGKYKYRKTEGLFDTTAIRQNADITAFRTEAALFRQIKTTGTAFVKAYYYQSNRGLPGAIVENRYYNPQRLWDNNFFVHSSIKNSFTEKYSLLLNLKYTNDYTRYQDPEYITTQGPLNNTYHQEEWYASLAQKYTVAKWWHIGLSTDFSYHKLDANLYRFAYPRRYAYIGSFSNSFIWNQLTIQAVGLYCYFDEHVRYYEGSADRAAISPALALSWQPFASKGFRLRSFYKEALRMPTFNDLYYTTVGNIFLKPEYTKQYDVGFTWMAGQPQQADAFSIQADAYYNLVRDKIVAVPSANLFRWMMLNLGSVSIKGLEVNINITKKLLRAITWNAGFSYTYQKALNKTTHQSSYNHQIPYMPVHSSTVHGNLMYRKYSLHYSFMYTGERYALPDNIARNYIQPWYTTDLGIVYNISKWKAGIDVNNLFNQYYDVVLNFPMPGRNYRLSITLNL